MSARAVRHCAGSVALWVERLRALETAKASPTEIKAAFDAAWSSPLSDGYGPDGQQLAGDEADGDAALSAAAGHTHYGYGAQPHLRLLLAYSQYQRRRLLVARESAAADATAVDVAAVLASVREARDAALELRAAYLAAADPDAALGRFWLATEAETNGSMEEVRALAEPLLLAAPSAEAATVWLEVAAAPRGGPWDARAMPRRLPPRRGPPRRRCAGVGRPRGVDRLRRAAREPRAATGGGGQVRGAHARAARARSAAGGGRGGGGARVGGGAGREEGGAQPRALRGSKVKRAEQRAAKAAGTGTLGEGGAGGNDEADETEEASGGGGGAALPNAKRPRTDGNGPAEPASGVVERGALAAAPAADATRPPAAAAKPPAMLVPRSLKGKGRSAAAPLPKHAQAIVIGAARGRRNIIPSNRTAPG